jgi:hypothetical protein
MTIFLILSPSKKPAVGFMFQPGEELVLSFLRFQICKDDGTLTALHLGTPHHHIEICADIWGGVDLIYQQQIAGADCRAALSGDASTSRPSAPRTR